MPFVLLCIRMKPSASASLLATASIALAMSTTCRAGEWAGLIGTDGTYNDALLAYATTPFLTDTLGGQRLDVLLEASAGLAMAPSVGASGNRLWHIGATPFIRYWWTDRTAMEIGIGAHLFSGTCLGNKTISTAFQFGDLIGMLHRLESSPWTLGIRFTHYSNADIKRPNPGQNYLGLLATHDFK